ncbi:MAG: GNAT family N-acetyltransferase [Anaerolineaceae bacterium]|nr:GNAT family N-acetyltransferase [Anaerolineaceae bacterium]
MPIIPFEQALIRVYQQDPCGTLPNAVWKTIQRLPQSTHTFTLDESGNVSALRVEGDRALFLDWRAASTHHPADLPDLSEYDFALLPAARCEPLDTTDFTCERYFRLIHRLADVHYSPLPDGFCWKVADAASEAKRIARLINACYKDMSLGAEQVRQWQREPVFDPTLWLWMWDEQADRPAGLGIADFDSAVGEGSLEWIQLLPAYRGRGLGVCLVSELLRRLRTKAAFTTVSGQVNNASRPDRVYQRCGFEGNVVWHVLRRKTE